MTNIIQPRAYRVNLSRTGPVEIEWRHVGQSGAKWYKQMDWSSGEPLEFETVMDAQAWIEARKDRL
jgi:hypothetical protein